MFTITVTDLWLHRRALTIHDPNRLNWSAVACWCGWTGPYRCREEERALDMAFHRANGTDPLWSKHPWVQWAIEER